MNVPRLIVSACLLMSVSVLSGCSSGASARSGATSSNAPVSKTDGAAPTTAAATKATPARVAPKGPAIRVTWQALAREKELYETSKFRRKGVVAPPQKIVLMSTSHPEAQRARSASTQAQREEHAGVAVLGDEEMLALVRGLKQRGYFRVARSGSGGASLADSDAARGLVRVEQDDQSWTLVSMRGQGQNPATQDIPRVYSEAKQAIMVLRNSNPTLSVSSVQRGTVQVR